LTVDGNEIDGTKYLERLREERERLKRRDGWTNAIVKLNLTEFPEWRTSIETLRLLSNCYKHDPSGDPDEELLSHLKLDLTVKYASLPESRCFREGLAVSLGLDKGTDYCTIVDQFLTTANLFLAAVEKQPRIAQVKWGAVSLSPDDAVC
jgi:hypothetical protein